jgi:hypothetical protein
VLPTITGTPAVGQVLTCATGTWVGQAPIGYTYEWRRAGTPIPGAGASTYTVVAADLDATLGCVVHALNGAGSATAGSPPVLVDAAPVVQAVPSITPSAGGARIGTALTCATGAWSGSDNTYAFSWNRNGAPIPRTSSSSYVVLTEDAGDALSCTVTATNRVGSAIQTTTATTVEPLTGGAPVPTVAPVITGSAVTGQTLTCSQGTWTGDPTITYVAIWQRNGASLVGGWTYTLTAADADAEISCLVVASSGSGRGAARSAPVGGNGCGGAVGVRINNGAARTTSAAVRLSIHAPAGATALRISNTPDFAGAVTVPVNDGCAYDWTMSSIPGLALDWTVYVRFGPDPATTYQDTITVDAPSGPALRR